MIAITELLQQILNGDYDAFKNQILAAFKFREKNKDAPTMDQIQPGMRVRVVIAQKALIGAVGTVAAKQKTFVLVDLDKAVGTLHKGVSCAPGQLELLHAPGVGK
jgi:hypothetical protein